MCKPGKEKRQKMTNELSSDSIHLVWSAQSSLKSNRRSFDFGRCATFAQDDSVIFAKLQIQDLIWFCGGEADRASHGCF
jgi:hypothetical protein